MTDKVGCLLMALLFAFSCLPLMAQDLNDEKDKQIEQIVESIAESGTEDDCPLIIEDLTNYSEKPLNINTASPEELERLNIIDFSQINNILAYRKQYGYILSSNELNAVDGLTPEIIKALEPFIIFEQPSDTLKTNRNYQRLLLRGKTSFPFAKGYASSSKNKPAAYPGIPVGMYSRYNFQIPGKLELGLTTDHDAGEDFFRGSNPHGFDYYSGFISWQSKTFIHQIIIGDYYLRFGQGLNFWNGGGIGKSANVMNIFKSGQGIRPYTSTDENQFFRGIATVLGQGPLKVMLFYSNKMRDANTIVDKNSGEKYFTSLETSGYHRTGSEIEDEKVLQEQDMGAYAELRLDKFRLGAQFNYEHFGLNMTTGKEPYKAKSFSGNENINTGIDYQLSFRRLQLFGEVGMSLNLKPAVIQGLIWHAHPQLSLSLFYRYFDPGFHAFYANTLSEGTECRNESGLYTGLEFNPSPKVKVSFYADFYHFPWLTYSTLAPSSGHDFMIHIDLSFIKNIAVYMQGKFETKSQKSTVAAGNPSDYDASTNKLRLNCQWRVTNKLMFKNNIEYTGYSYHDLTENGYLIYQDLVYSPFPKFDMWFRYAWFHTDGYNSRIYTYENDILYGFSIPEFHGKGNRIYLNLKWRPSQFVTAYFKIGRTIHAGVDSWGSGNDMTMGKSRIELHAELNLRF